MGCLVLESFWKGNRTLGVEVLRNLEVIRNGLPKNLGIPNMRNRIRTGSEVSSGTWAF